MSPARRRVVVVLAVLAVLVGPALVGYGVGRERGSAPRSSAVPVLDSGAVASVPADPGSRASAPFDAGAIADRVEDAVVNITTRYASGGLAAGTGIVLSSSGLVLTNNHVIAEADSLTVEFGSSGITRRATVLGYSLVEDVALLQVQNVSNLRIAPVGDSSSVGIGDPVVALGNAGGRGGAPSVVSGTVTGLDEQITASDAGGRNVQTLSGLIGIAADIRSGDSGGPIVDRRGNVIGMSVAASVSGGGFGLPSSGGQGYAIPIEHAVAIAEKIASGEGGPEIHVGAYRGVLGVSVQPELTPDRRIPGSPGATGSAGAGARVLAVEPGSGAAEAGITAGSVITAVGSRTVSSANDLTRALVPYNPGERVRITWTAPDGSTERATVTLGSGPPA